MIMADRLRSDDDLMITIWLQQFVDNDDDVYDHDGYVDEQHTDAKVQLS